MAAGHLAGVACHPLVPPSHDLKLVYSSAPQEGSRFAVTVQAPRLFNRYSIPANDGRVSSTAATLLEDLLLFDDVIVDTAHFEELTELIRIFGAHAVLTLLKTNCLKLNFDLFVLGSSTRNAIPPRGSQPLPPNQFSIGTIGWPPEERSKQVHRAFLEVARQSGASGKAFIKLKSAIADRFVLAPTDAQRVALQDESTHDLCERPDLLAQAVALQLKRARNMHLSPQQLKARVELVEAGVFRVVEHNLGGFGIQGPEATHAISNAALAIGARNRRIAHMRMHGCIAGFHSHDIPLVEEKLDFLEAHLSPERQRERLHRVVEIGGLPKFESLIDARQLNLETFIEVRNSSACQEFRKWLVSSDGVADDLIAAMCASVRAKLGALATSKMGRAIRLLTTKGSAKVAGLDPTVGTALGAGLGALDKFLVGTVFKVPGHVAFLSNSYPSLYDTSSIL